MNSCHSSHFGHGGFTAGVKAVKANMDEKDLDFFLQLSHLMMLGSLRSARWRLGDTFVT